MTVDVAFWVAEARASNVATLFHAQVAQRPSAPALVSEQTELSYADTPSCADLVAHVHEEQQQRALWEAAESAVLYETEQGR